jgi:hypothetical protein
MFYVLLASIIYAICRFMAAPLDPNSKTRQVLLKAPEPWFAALDDWRRQQPDIPNVSESIRRLVTMALTMPTEASASDRSAGQRR